MYGFISYRTVFWQVGHMKLLTIVPLTGALMKEPMKLALRPFMASGIALLLGAACSAQNVVTNWTAIASNTIVAQGGKGPGSASVWFAYASIAVYDAVNSVHGKYQPFYFEDWHHRSASDEAAAIAAAHAVLVHYFPAQQAALDASYQTSLAAINAPRPAIGLGVTLGEESAQALISARTGDGLEANVPYTPGSGPGVWQPTPPGYLPAATPWLGQMRPFTLSSPAQFLPAGPYALSSEEWAANYNLTRLFGDATSTVRTPGQTEIGLFWTENTSQQYARAFTYLVQNYHLSLPESARMMALLWTGAADSIIGCFNGKYTYNFWRPVTAITAGGGNTELAADPAWSSLGTTPNHPEYPAAHACITSAVSNLVKDYFGTSKVNVVVDSLAFKDGIHVHNFTTTDAWLDEVGWARMLAGFHFLHSVQDGAKLGEEVSKHVSRTAFQPKR